MIARFWVLIMITPLFAGSMVDRVKIGRDIFTLLTESYHLYDSRGESVKFYKEQKNEDLTYLLTLVLEDKTGGCSGKTIQRGAYEVVDGELILYTLWDKSGTLTDVPHGARIQHYKAGKEGGLTLLSSHIYIELADALNEKDQKKLTRYIKRMEKLFEGDFVLGQEGKKLLRKVEEALRKKQPRWKN
jgi:hypothetical protein